MPTYRFPNDFFFGAAMSGPQTEGRWCADGKLPNLWDAWSNLNIDDFYNKVGSYVGNDFMTMYREDLDLLKSLGLNSFRTSIQWSRLMTEDNAVNPAGAAWYHELFSYANSIGLTPFVNLYHFDMPICWFDKGGWESRAVVEAYREYAEAAFKEFGTEVKYWFTFNEPIVEPEQRYQAGYWFPFVANFNRARAVQYNISIAHAMAVETFRTLKTQGALLPDSRIGLINCFTPPYTKDEPTPADLEAVRMTDGINNRWWLDLVTKGTLPQDVIDSLSAGGCELPVRPGDDKILANGVVDWLGCNYYHPERVQAPDAPFDANGCPVFAKHYDWPDARMNESRGWEIYPKGIYDFGMSLKENYPELEFFVSENGMGIENEYLNRGEDGRVQDDYRIEFVHDHLEWIARAIADGAKCTGYHYWAVIDNWSWNNAFKNRYGFVEVDLMQNYRRRPKLSADWLREVATTHELRDLDSL